MEAGDIILPRKTKNTRDCRSNVRMMEKVVGRDERMIEMVKEGGEEVEVKEYEVRIRETDILG